MTETAIGEAVLAILAELVAIPSTYPPGDTRAGGCYGRGMGRFLHRTPGEVL